MKMKLNQPTVYETEGVRLMPGANDVDPKRAEKFLANKMVQADMKAGIIDVEKRGRPAKSADAEAG